MEAKISTSERKQNLAPKPIEQGRKIVDLILEAEISTTEKNEKRKKRNPAPKLTE